MKEEVLEFLAAGNTKVAAMHKFGLTRYKLEKVLRDREGPVTQEDSCTKFVHEFVDEGAEAAAFPLDNMYRVYCGYCVSANSSPVSLREFVDRILTACDIARPDIGYFNMCKTKSHLTVFVKCTKTKRVLDYYASMASNSFLRNRMIGSLDSEFDKDCIKLLTSDIDFKGFIEKWGSIKYIYNLEEEPVESTVEVESDREVDSTKVESPGEAMVECIYNDATSFVEQDMVSRKFYTLKSLQRFFHVVHVCKPAVKVVLCDDRHNITAITGSMDAAPVFETLQSWQMEDAGWMESKANAWIESNVQFNTEGVALQKICLYTTGYNALNLAMVKCAMQKKVNLNAMHYNPKKNDYWQQELITSFPTVDQPLSRFVEPGKYFVHGEISGEVLYRLELKMNDVDNKPYEFVSTDKDVIQMIRNNLSYKFVKHPYTMRIYRHDGQTCTKIFGMFVTEEDME